MPRGPHTHFTLPLASQVPPDWAQRMHVDRWPELFTDLPPDWPRHVQRSLALPDNAEVMLATLPPTWMAIMAEVGGDRSTPHAPDSHAS